MKFGNIVVALKEDDKGLASWRRLIPRGNLNTDKKIVESLTKLAFILYIDDKVLESKSITDKLSKIPFFNDYDYWTWIEFAISLNALIAKDEGKNQIFDESLGKINSALNYGEGLIKKVKLSVHQRFMAGEGINIDELNSHGNLSLADEFDCRLIYLMRLVKIKVLGGSPEYPISKVLDDMAMNISEIKAVFKEVSLSDVEPFRKPIKFS